MIDQNQPTDQLPKEIKPAFHELNLVFLRLFVSYRFRSVISPEKLVSFAGE